MADLNPITIQDFPEVTELLSTDKVILFAEDDSRNLCPYLIDLSSFGQFALSAGSLENLKHDVAELEKRCSDIEKEFNKTYMTLSQIKAEYSTISSYKKTIAKIETTEHFKNSLSAKASDEFAEAKFSQLKNKVQDMKRFIGSWQWDNDDDEEGWGYKRIVVAAAKKGKYS